MTPKELKQKKFDFLQETINRCLKEPALTTEELLYAVCFELCSTDGLKAIPKIIKKLKVELKNRF